MVYEWLAAYEKLFATKRVCKVLPMTFDMQKTKARSQTPPTQKIARCRLRLSEVK